MKQKVKNFLKKRWWLLIILGVIILFLANRQQKAVEVELATVESKTITRAISASGSLSTKESDKVFAPLTGQIDSVSALEGAVVKQGDLLMTYDAESLTVAVEQARAAYLAAEKALQATRNTTLSDTDIKA